MNYSISSLDAELDAGASGRRRYHIPQEEQLCTVTAHRSPCTLAIDAASSSPELPTIAQCDSKRVTAKLQVNL